MQHASFYFFIFVLRLRTSNDLRFIEYLMSLKYNLQFERNVPCPIPHVKATGVFIVKK